MYLGEKNKTVLNTIKSGTKINTGTKTVLTNQARNLIHNVKRTNDNNLKQLSAIPIDREKIKTKAQNIIKEDKMYVPPSQMGQGATMVRNVANPYNPKIKSESIVDQKDRYKIKDDAYPKVKVDNSTMQKRVRKVRSYLYKINGDTVARKQEYQPKQAFDPAE